MAADGIEMADVWFGYAKDQFVLKGLTMNVEPGQIYGLLGASGCGKTTSMKLLLGNGLRAERGRIRTLGREPGARGHCVPGAGAGYMPQEPALEAELTVGDCFAFYGRLYGMREAHVRQRQRYLLRFLELGEAKAAAVVSTLSGGQARRLSLALTLLHSPRLLVLDEPTVGVDVVLAAKIWDLLFAYARGGGTILITTHYIAECARADRVGLMRDGRLLAEDAPAALVGRYAADSLEGVFLQLCRSDDVPGEEGGGDIEGEPDPEELLLKGDGEAGETETQVGHLETAVDAGALWPRLGMVLATAFRGLSRLRRNPAFLPFAVGLPVIQVIIFCLAVGPAPKDLGFCVVDDDASFMGARLVGELGDGGTFSLDQSTDWGACVGDVRAGDAWGALRIPENFTRGLAEAAQCEPDWATDAQLTLAMDLSNQQISLTMEQKVLEALEATVAVGGGDATPDLIDVEAVYGSTDATFTDFIAPGMIPSIIYGQSLGLTAITFVIDKKRGVSDRLWSVGISPLELLLGTFLVQAVILAIQIILLLFFALVVFDLSNQGSVLICFLIALVLGFAGMAYGLVIAGVARELEHALQMALGSVFPFMLLSGVLWPLQGAPTAVKAISYCLPTTWSAEAFRAVFSRGWGLEHSDVYLGPLVSGAWCVVMVLLAAHLMKTRR